MFDIQSSIRFTSQDGRFTFDVGGYTGPTRLYHESNVVGDIQAICEKRYARDLVVVITMREGNVPGLESVRVGVDEEPENVVVDFEQVLLAADSAEKLAATLRLCLTSARRARRGVRRAAGVSPAMFPTKNRRAKRG